MQNVDSCQLDINMSYYLVLFIRKVNSLSFITNVFFQTATERRGTASPAFTLSEAATRGILWKKVFLKILQNL